MRGNIDSRRSLADDSNGKRGRTSDIIRGDLRPFEQRLADDWPVANWQNLHIVLAVSGGADSIALLRAVSAIKKTSDGTGLVYVAHFDHGLRGDAGHADADWVAETCRRLNVPLDVERGDVRARAGDLGDGIEAAARTARYEFLLRVAERVGARFVVTAHTSDDQAETVLHRILRGTGLAGLAGIPVSRLLSNCVTLARPMLGLRRAQVIEYLEGLGQDYREDSSNSERVYARNWIRHEILPAIRQRLNSDVYRALIRLAEQAADAQSIIQEQVARVATECVTVEMAPQVRGNSDTSRCAHQIRLNCQLLAGYPEAVIREVCRAAWTEADWPQQSMGTHEWRKLALLVAEDGACAINLPGNVLARRINEQLILSRAEPRGLP